MISVIIPIYKVENYLRECVDSVINQTYPDLEIILVDDGSPDNCGEICDKYVSVDNRISVIHKENGGLSDARNFGLDMAHGDYVYFLDSDDYLRNDAIEKMVSAVESEKADMVFFDAETIYEDYPDKDYRECFIRDNAYKTAKGSLVLRKQIKLKEYYPCVPFLFFRKSFLEKNNLCFVKDIMHEDELFTVLAFIRAKRVVQVREALYVRRLRSKSITTEKISVESIKGLYACICGFDNEIQYYGDNSDERKVLRLCIKRLSGEPIRRFLKLSHESKRTGKHFTKKTSRILKKYYFFGDIKMRLKYAFPRMYDIYFSVKKKIVCFVNG